MTKEDYEEWKELPQTKEFFLSLVAKKQEILAQWSEGMFTSSRSDETVQLNSHAIGQVSIINELLEESYDEYKERV